DGGCGSGKWLRTLLEWGASAQRLHGVELLHDRIQQAKKISPAAIDFQVSDGWPIPFADRSMDLVCARTVFSSILDSRARSALAAEMRRVVKDGGYILVFDFRVKNPRNPDTT